MWAVGSPNCLTSAVTMGIIHDFDADNNSKAFSTILVQVAFLDKCLPSEVSIGRSSSNYSGLSHSVPGAVDLEDVSSSLPACFESVVCSSLSLFLTRYRK